MSRSTLQRRLAGEEGFAMIAAITVSSVLVVFTLAMLASGMHLQQSTVRDAAWNEALSVAEAGVDRAVHEITTNPGYTGTGGTPMAVPGGEVEITVTGEDLGEISIEAVGYVPSRDAAQRQVRRLFVTYGPEDVFKYALFSTTGLFVKNNAVTYGDLFANNSILLEQNSTVYGSVISATGTIELQNNATIRRNDGEGGNAYTGGYHTTGLWSLRMANGSVVEGSAFAQAETCPGTTADNSRYNIQANGTIQGDAAARGTISGSVQGSRTPFNCQLRHATKTLPEYRWSPDLYVGEVEYTSIAQWTSLGPPDTALKGVHRVWDEACTANPSASSSVINMNGAQVVDDFVFVTNCRVDAVNNFKVVAPQDSLVNIIVLNGSTDPAAVEIKNNFEVTNDAAVLLYSTGLIHVKNNIEETGAVYAGAISVKNNMDVVYDARVERTLGFGDIKYDRIAWQECKASGC
ncbi:MAG TPA: hypothetical protein VM618_07040 [Acidimicrobiia bacterium]|nr:hypothetical protein [Acidimicrobiia bacterium]